MAELNATNSTCPLSIECKNGTLLPAWEPLETTTGMLFVRAAVYLLCLLYMFLGVSLIADRFMGAIEVITSKERKIQRMVDGRMETLCVRVWNPTVSNLSLMALGSSAPEILLSVIEIVGKDFNAGALGPGTIVGSAAFNLFIIVAVCMISVPDNEVRKIEHLGVFLTTAVWSIFAYIWLFLILVVITPDRVDLSEAIMTFLFFPLTVITSYVADRKILQNKFLPRRHKLDHVEMQQQELEVGFLPPKRASMTSVDSQEHRAKLEYMSILRQVKSENPGMDMNELIDIAGRRALDKTPKSRAFYRIQGTRQMTGGTDLMCTENIDRAMLVIDAGIKHEEKVAEEDKNVQRVFFRPPDYVVLENAGTVCITVVREGGDLNSAVEVNYATQDGTASSGTDYVAVSGTIRFKANETSARIEITIMDDDVFEEDEHFQVILSDPKFESKPTEGMEMLELGKDKSAIVAILDDDHPGVFTFESGETDVHESIGEAKFRVMRTTGARGVVKVPYKTIEGTAKGNGDDFDAEDGELIFENDETEKSITVKIINDEEYERHEYFFLELGEPILTSSTGGPSTKVPRSKSEKEIAMSPSLGLTPKLKVSIVESIEFKNALDKILKKGNLAVVVGTTSWKQQFNDAIHFPAGEDGSKPSCLSIFMHILSFPWKLIFACVPPTEYLDGWLCFCVAIAVIGFMTALIGDLASHFGCTIGLSDAVTAITFVALGTSLPDTFASRVAAIGDSCADASIVNVTGSNAVNVFLGLGVAWTLAAIVHKVRKDDFVVVGGSLSIGVSVFVFCAILTVVVVMIRRRMGGELGGKHKYAFAAILICFWLFYVLIVSLVEYCHIPGSTA